MADQVQWGDRELSLVISWDTHAAPSLTAVAVHDVTLVFPDARPLLELLTVADGHAQANDRLISTEVGGRARYVTHRESSDEHGKALVIEVADPISGLTGEIELLLPAGTATLRSSVMVSNHGSKPVVLRSVSSWVSGLGCLAGAEDEGGVAAWTIHRGVSDWLGEGRWVRQPANRFRFPDLGQELTGHDPRGAFTVVSTGTWSTGKQLPVACAESEELGAAWVWQVEHNGPWRWEVGQNAADGYFALSGPTDVDHQWLKILAPGEPFRTVPVSVTLASTFTAAVANLTRYRRATRRAHPDNASPKVVFNDYMNTINGDPTTDRLMPLIDAAAKVGAEVFCIDAGWYDDGGDWWDSVGEWEASTTRFPGGLDEVITRIRECGMTPGLWLEPEVVGVRSPVAERLPDAAFLQRAGQRVVEHCRYHLDLRHPAARSHLDAVVDRLVERYGVGYFKLDYNINPGAGTDWAADSVGDGLLGHNRAHQAWLDGVLDRHPDLILENCGSGAMRADFAMLSRLQLQSTSDQQDFRKYPTIAAAAPVSMLPEQAANWAYPQPSMTAEEVAFCLVTGLSGRLYLSGYLNRMSADHLRIVSEAVALGKAMRTNLTHSVPSWPLGLPEWDASWIALALTGPEATFLTLWNRSTEEPQTVLPLGLFTAGADPLIVKQVFPTGLSPWPTTWHADSGLLQVTNPTGVIGARVFRISSDVGDGARIGTQ